MSEDEAFYVGDPWYVTALVEPLRAADKGKLPGEVTGVYYSPAEWARKERHEAVSGQSVVFAKVAESTEGSTWEVLAIGGLTEPGIWRIVVSSTAPLKGVTPDLITVQPVSEF